MILYIINAIALTIFQIGTYLIWFDRKNILNHLFIGFCIVAYWIPSFVFDFNVFASEEIIQKYFLVNSIGACFFLFGILLGNKWKKFLAIDTLLQLSIVEKNYDFNSELLTDKIIHIVKIFYLASLIVMCLCFVYMGFIPMFARDPFMAKQFKGEYQHTYQHVAFFYRTAKVYIQILLPFIALYFFKTKQKYYLLLALWGFSSIVITMSRGDMVTGLLIVLTIVVAENISKSKFVLYLIFLISIYSLGSGLWSILALLFPNSPFNVLGGGESDINILKAISLGAPDIPDQLSLLEAFNYKEHFTYGLTFIGGLIPYNFHWNPAVWTLSIVNDTSDISEIASGGLRVPVSMWGYFSFGWIGVCIVPFLSGLFTGYITKKMRNIVNKLKSNFDGYIVFYFLIFLYMNIAFVFTNFYQLSIYSLPPFILFFLIMRYVVKRNLQVETKI